MAVNLNYLSEFTACRDAAAEAVDLARSQGALGILPALADTLATTQIGLGEWEAASATATESLRLAYDTGQSHYGALLLWVLADIAAFRGRREECRAHFAEAAALDGGHVSWAGHDAAEIAFGHLALARGEIDEAIGHLEREVDPDAEQAAFGYYYAAFDLAEAYVRANRSNEATSLIERIAPHTHQAWARAALDRCRGLVAADDAFDALSRASAGESDSVAPAEASRRATNSAPHSPPSSDSMQSPGRCALGASWRRPAKPPAGGHPRPSPTSPLKNSRSQASSPAERRTARLPRGSSSARRPSKPTSTAPTASLG
jgi:tetratricopeptide (TPR) repeat protein